MKDGRQKEETEQSKDNKCTWELERRMEEVEEERRLCGIKGTVRNIKDDTSSKEGEFIQWRKKRKRRRGGREEKKIGIQKQGKHLTHGERAHT